MEAGVPILSSYLMENDTEIGRDMMNEFFRKNTRWIALIMVLAFLLTSYVFMLFR